jgi:hypothetical protein
MMLDEIEAGNRGSVPVFPLFKELRKDQEFSRRARRLIAAGNRARQGRRRGALGSAVSPTAHEAGGGPDEKRNEPSVKIE